MNILWLSWKGIDHPEAGGAEVVGHELRRRMVLDGHTVTLLTSRHPGASERGSMEGYDVIRVGGRFSVYWKVYRYYTTHLKGKYDLVIDECNTMPFFAQFYAKTHVTMVIYQLAREIWFYQMPLPIALVGWIVEPLYLRLLTLPQKNLKVALKNFPGRATFKEADSFAAPSVITISESTKKDLMRIGFSSDRIHIISLGIMTPPVSSLSEIKKEEKPTILSLGTMRPMKRTLDILYAFEIAKESIPDLRLIIAGNATGSYGSNVKKTVAGSRHVSSIRLISERISDEERIDLMRHAHVFVSASVREGWGLVVTEANSQGTPAVVYDVHGLRDSVKDGKTGIIAKKNNPEGLAEGIARLLSSQDDYEKIRKAGWEWSKERTLEKQYQDFKKAVKI